VAVSLTRLPACCGISLKPEYFTDIRGLAGSDSDLWFEIHPENYMIPGGPRLDGLLAIAADYPISLHGVGASLGGPIGPLTDHLKAMQSLIDRVQPAAISEHAVWSRTEDQYFAELLPSPRTRAAIEYLVTGVDQYQSALQRTILIENQSHYLTFRNDYAEPEFLVEVATRTGCGLLLDINNLYISANNCGIDPDQYIQALPPALVGEIHIAGYTPDAQFGRRLLIDSHAEAVADPVWDLLDRALTHLGPVPVLIERDANLPPLASLLIEKQRADAALSRLTNPEVYYGR
jgi:uncharacterized protein (UPF0276 family)